MEIYYWKEGTDRRTADKKRRTTGNPVRFLPFGILASRIRKKKKKKKKSIYVQENSGKDDYKHE